MTEIRKLTQADYDGFESFLAATPTTTMFLRANAARAGMDNQGQAYQADYFGTFEGGQLIGVTALNWNGNIYVQFRDRGQVDASLQTALQQVTSFKCQGVLGPDDQVLRILNLMNPDTANVQMDMLETTFHLSLDNMIVPAQLQSGIWRCRPMEERDIEQLVPWGVDYDAEALGSAPAADAEEKERTSLLSRLGQGIVYVLEDNGRLVAKTNFNARLPSVVQIGGVYTPPEERSKGYARAAVAGQLLLAQQEGVTEALLFTKTPAAVRAYKSIGFVQQDNYHLTLFKIPFRPVLNGTDAGGAHGPGA